MIFHLVSGDCLAELIAKIRITGEIIVCREALVDGPIDFPDLNTFWNARGEFAGAVFGATADDYQRRVADELSRLRTLGKTDELNLWFGDDLFCQANMWFALSLMESVDCSICRVFPEGIDFGVESYESLMRAFDGRRSLTASDRRLACELWKAFARRDRERLEVLSKSGANGFRRLEETILAAVDIDVRPRAVIAELQSGFGDDFAALFKEFSRREAIYGFGDTQVRARLWPTN